MKFTPGLSNRLIILIIIISFINFIIPMIINNTGYAYDIPETDGEYPPDEHSSIPAAEAEALIALYNSTNGANWTHNDSWLGPRGTECSWFGVTCEEGHVVGLSLGGNNLDGTLPLELGNLTYLRVLSLNDNKLTGSIPSSFGNLTSLTTLDLGANGLTGDIPKELGSLENLSVMGLSRNKLSGAIPAELGNLSQLTQLNLEENELSGEIPPELGNLTNLILLSLFANNLTGSIPSSLGNLVLLQYLFLGNNQLSGEIPSVLGNLAYLIKLHLMNNLLTGSIPSELGNLSYLTELDLAGNKLTGEIPASFGNLFSLVLLNLSENLLTGNIPPVLGYLSGLQHLSLYSNGLTGGIPSEFGHLLSLYYLFLDMNKLTGSIPETLGNLTNLVQLHLTSNKLTGNIPGQLGNLSHLEEFLCGDNNLTGNIPPELGNLGNLQSLDLSGNKLDGPIPTTFGRLSALKALNLMGNQLTGIIPAELGYLTGLTYLGLNENHLEGYLPSTLGNLISLMMFLVEKNMLQGPVPSDILSLTGLENGGSDFRYNGLWTTDESVRSFMNQKQTGGDWENTQTVAPSHISASPACRTSIDVFWSPIEYTYGESGSGYEVYYSENSEEGPFSLYETTPDKEADRISVTGLKPDTTYYFKVRTKTNDGYNIIFSNFTDIVSATTSEDILPDIPQAEINALIDFYNSTGGPKWKNNSNWLSESVSPCEWFGIKCENGHVVEIQLPDNNLTGTLPESLGSFSELKILNLGNSDISHAEVMSNDMPNQISGSIPKILGTLSNLEKLILRKNKFTGDIPPELGNLTKLIHLDLDFNLLTGNIPSTLSKLASLEKLFLRGNQLTGIIPSELGNLVKLMELYLEGNSLTGVIPPSFGNLTSLMALALSNNKITGKIPEELGNLTLLEYLGLNDNLLTGNLPVQLGNLSLLKYLMLNNNKLTGSIPVEWGNLGKLETLYLANNLLTGTIPKEMGGLSGLSYMDISDNSLTGPIPSELINLSNLVDGENDFRNNFLFIEPPNKILYEFLNQKQIGYDWLSYQTLTTPASVEPGLTQADFTMISFYINPENPSATAMFGDDIGVYDTANYRIGGYDPMMGGYVEYSPRLEINPGRAIWFFARNGVVLKVKGNPVSLEKDIDIELKFNPETGDGWNMIGVPNNIYYKWDYIVVVVKDDTGQITDTKPISDPGAENYISRRALWRWKKGEGDYTYYTPSGEIAELANDFDANPCMEPQAGYWVKALKKNVFLRFEKDAQLDLCIGPDETMATLIRKGKHIIRPAKAFAYGEDSPPMPMNAFAGVGTEDSPVAGSSGCFINSSSGY